MKNYQRLKGLIAASFTPMDAQGKINLSVIDKYADLMAKSGMTGVFVCGTTGESLSLTTNERKSILEQWVKSSNGRFKVIAHVGSNSQVEAVELARHAAETGADAIAAMDEDLTQAYDQINDLSEELEDLEADLYEDEDAEDEDDDAADEDEDAGDDDIASEPFYEVACPACGETVYVSEDDLDAGEAICPSCNVAFEVALADEDDDEAPEEPDDGPARYEVTCPACGATSVVDEEALLDGEPVCPACGKPLDFEVTEE